jgi:addiction module HigA family antidote
MALRLSKCLGRSPESWLAMQDIYDLWQAKDKIDLADIEPLSVTA